MPWLNRIASIEGQVRVVNNCTARRERSCGSPVADLKRSTIDRSTAGCTRLHH